ncbi:ATP-binding cassette domain-containing protein [Actinobacteria bacterium YIM 96077]|uniref:Daunorubicin/doxorubicin resistance ABC transporter ATP-binding protein DrrA n=1 Tax=Phytoactinopolyspora halophila TaxID=1981511 RepID=A0A329R2J5_9ACTN|nr:ATP-binding cassette domain-containing protein [Phytoactinopolyspora halophila]AYY12183.1 ATP-binding cassette domain-containing protein [Actinobacteria bacterium YIM 96077]RAW18583.1 daunorubicin/doxorubicin resistance ABC transporter ATP-binding protein DrrA [Phytoactinopolyspora halophila]
MTAENAHTRTSTITSGTTLAIEASGLAKSFGTTRAVDGVDFTIEAGTVHGLLGPNGAGKTTVVRLLATLLRPDAGRAAIMGHDIIRDPAAVRRRISLTGQFASVDEDLTGAENLTMFGQLLDLPKSAAKVRARELLDEFQLTEAGDNRVRTYSGGMRRRLDLAASLIGRPDVVFLDEPTTGLDPGKREELWQMIRSIARSGGTVLLTTQYMEEADALADQITVINHGTVIARGTPPELKRIVGGQIVVVRPKDTARISEAASIVQAVLGYEPDAASTEVLTAPVDGDADFARIVARLASAGIEVVELSLRLPSLDEVFYTLTGRQTDNDENQGAAA